MSGSPANAGRKRKLAFDSPAKEARRTHAWVTKAGQANMFFVELAGSDTGKMTYLLEAMNSATTRGSAKVTSKNENVASALTGSDLHTAKLMDAVKKVVSFCPIKSDDLKFFATKNQAPKVMVKKRANDVEVTGNLYMLEPFLLDPEGFDGVIVEPESKYRIPIAEDFSADDIGTAVKTMAEKWGYQFGAIQ